ncbi:MAG: hypothetical protein R3C32_00195 [Chloroflexota bacterium]
MPTYQQLPYWHASMAPIPDPPAHALPDRADVVVVGGGYTGTVAALQPRARAHGWSCWRRSPWDGAPARNGGLVHPGLQWGRATLQRRYGEMAGRRVVPRRHGGVPCRRASLHRVRGVRRRLSLGARHLAWSSGDMTALESELDEMRTEGFTGRALQGPGGPITDVGTDHYPGANVVDESGVIHPGRYWGSHRGRGDRRGGRRACA